MISTHCVMQFITSFIQLLVLLLGLVFNSSISIADSRLAVVNLAEQNLKGKNHICARFSTGLDTGQDIQSYFSISKKGGELVEGGWLFFSEDKLACFSNTQPDTAYEVTIYKQLPARSGVRLARNHQASITTRHLEPAVSFDTRGSVLMPGISQGLPVAGVNVPAVDVTFHRVKPGSREQVLDKIGSSYTYSLAHQLGQFSELVYTGQFNLHSEENRRVQRTIKTQDIQALQQPGLYLAVMKPAGTYTDSPRITHFTVTDLGLHVRSYWDQLDVYVNSLISAEPLADVKVSLVDEKGQILKQTRSTASGYASFVSPPEKATLLLAEKGDHQSLLRLKGPALDLSEFELGERMQQPQTLFIYSERDIYRPGETLHFNALLRDQDGQLQAAPMLKAKLLQPDGQVVRRISLSAREIGFYEQIIELPDNASTGQWRLEIAKPDGNSEIFSFKVEEFLPERMKLSFTDGSGKLEVLSPEQPVSTLVSGEYLYGAPAGGNRLSTKMSISHWRSPVEVLKGYQFGDVLDERGLGSTELEDQFLDEKGKATLKGASHWQDARSPLKLRLLSSLYESGGRPVTRAYEQLIWPGEALIGIRPEFREDENPAANSRVRFDLVRATVDGEKLAARSLDVSLIREERQYFWEYSDGRGWHYEFSEQEYPVSQQSISIEEGHHSTVELPVEWGDYRLEITNPEDKTKSSLRFFAGTDWHAEREAGAQSSRPDVVGLSLDKPAYKAGDVARLTINPPHAGEALILVESDEPLWTHRQPIDKAGGAVEIPVDAAWLRHDIHISVVVLRPASEVAGVTPTRAFGLLHLPLDRQARKLSLEILSTERSKPNQSLSTTVQLKDAQPDKQYFVTLAAVDVGVLNLTDFETPDPHKGFFERRRYGVESRDIYGSLIELNQYETAKLKFGGDAPSRGGKAPASDIQIVSLHSGLVKIDANGKAEIQLNIPDFNGRLRLMAVAFSEDTFGSAEREVTIAAPLVTQLSMPRFIASGDEATLALDLHNMSGAVQSLTLQLSAERPLSIDNAERELILADGEKSTLRFPVNSGYGGAFSALKLKVNSDSLQFQRDWKMAIRPPYPLRREQQQLQIAAGEAGVYDLDMLDKLLPQSSGGNVSINNQLKLGAERQMKALLQYPYGCLEQSSSRAWPWLYADVENTRRFQLPETTQEKRLKNVEDALRQLESKQLENGGFGLWDNHSPEEHWLTVYVAELMLDAEEMGFPVQQVMKGAALKRLEAYLRQTNMGFSRYTEHSQHYRFAFRSYAAYVLSRVNRANLGQMRSLFDHHADSVRSGLPLVHLGLALLKQGDKLRGEKAIQLGLEMTRKSDDYLGDYGSVIRDDASMIQLLIDYPAYKQQVLPKLPALAEAVSSQQYLSTQERNAVFRAAIALQQGSQKNWQAELVQGGKSQILDQAGEYTIKLDQVALADGVTIKNLSDQLLWSTLSIEGYPRQLPVPESSGFEIERSYYDREGKPLDVSELSTGDLVLVHLLVSSKERMQDTLVVDLLPAGLELENQNLEHSIKLEQFKIDGKSIPELQSDTQIIHQEFRDDRFVAAIDHGSYNLQSHLFYLARAVTPGTYQVPPPFVEDMYRPQKRAIGVSPTSMRVVNQRP